MPLTIPAHIEAKLSDYPPSFKWTSDVWHPMERGETLSGESYKPTLQKKYFVPDVRAVTGLAAACGEWVAWRLKGHARDQDVDDALARIESMWTAARDPRSATLAAACDYPVKDQPCPQAQGALELMVTLLQQHHQRVLAGDSLSPLPVFGIGLLAEHVHPDGKALRAWLTKMLSMAAKRYPKGTATPVIRETFAV